MKKFLITAFALALVAGMVLSCGDEEETVIVPGEAQESAAAASMALGITEMAMIMSPLFQGMEQQGAAAASTAECPFGEGCPVSCTVNITTTLTEIYADYEGGCTEGGVYKSGEISISFEQGTSSILLNITTTNYTEGDESFDGTLTADLQKTVAGANLNLDADVTFTNPQESCLVILDETTVVDFNGSPLNALDDNATVNGNDTVTCDNGTLTLDLSDVVIDLASCKRNPVSGTIDIHASNAQTNKSYDATITFHSTCDGKAEVDVTGPNFHFVGTVDL